MSYCCDNSETKNIFAVSHGSAASRPCVHCLPTASDIEHFRCCKSRYVKQSKVVRTHARENVKVAKKQSTKVNKSEHQMLMKRGKQKLGTFLMSSWKSFFEQCSPAPRNENLYSFFTFEPLYNLRHGNSKLVKVCTTSYLFSDNLERKSDAPWA